jgi:hypothetical protein
MAAVEQMGRRFGILDHSPANRITDRRITEFTLLLATLFVLDIITTHAILRLGGVELNPAMAGIVASPFVHIAVKAGTLLLIVIVALIAETKVKGSSIAFYSTIVTLYLFVIVNNAFVLVPQLAGF